MNCPLPKKQVLYGGIAGTLPCHYLLMKNDVCTHGETFVNFNPLKWTEDEKKIVDPYILFENNKFLKTNFCDSCEYKNDLTDFENSIDGLMVFIMISDECNLSCRMCGPMQSSKIFDKQYQFFKKNNLMDIVKNVTGGYFNNDYSFVTSENQFQWIINNVNKIKAVTITGGEPLYTKRFYKLLDKFIQDGYSQDVTLKIYTNGTLFNKKTLSYLNQFKKVYYTISIDGTYGIFDYIRYPFNFSKFEKSLNYLMVNKKNETEINFLMTLNSMNIFDVNNFINWSSMYENVKINFNEVWPNDRGIGLQTLPIQILNKLNDIIDYRYINSIIDRSIVNNAQNKNKLKKELELFDLVNETDYHTILNKNIIEWIDG